MTETSSSIALTFALCICGFLSLVSGTLGAGAIVRFGFPLPNEKVRISCIDGLRGYLALSVMVYHFILWIEVTRLGGDWSRPKMAFFDSLGPGSVNLFFMTTGFVFYPRILGGLRGANWRAIYISRVFRIMPLLIVSVIAVSAVILRRINLQPTQHLELNLVNLFRWIVCWDEPSLFVYRDSARVNAGVLWSLGFEWQFYLFVLPVCTAAMTLRGRAPTWCIPVTLIVVSMTLRPLHTLALITYLPLFGVGMIAFELKEREEIAAFLSTRAASAVALAFFIAGSVLFNGAIRLLCHVMFFICVACGTSIWGLLRISAARALGELSYGIYLLHGLVLSIVFVDLSQMIVGVPAEGIAALMPVAAAATVLLSASTFLLVERPFINIGKLVGRKRRSQHCARLK